MKFQPKIASILSHRAFSAPRPASGNFPRCLRAVCVAAAMISIAALNGCGQRRAASGDQVIATAGDLKITKAQVDDKARIQLTAIQNQVYMAEKRAVDQIIDDYLVEQAAKKAGLTQEAYLKKEIDDKAPAPTDKEMQDFYDKNKDRIRQPMDKIKAPLANYLKQQKLRERRAELIAQLRKDLKVKIALEPPRFKVASEDSAGMQGPKDAPITIVEFSDFQCPYCRSAEGSIKEVMKKYPDKVRLIYMDYPLPMHPNAMGAAQAGRCAAAQGKFWEFHDAMFADQTKLDPPALKATATNLKLDTTKFNECLDKNAHTDDIHRTQEQGQAAGVNGTPTFFVNGRMLSGMVPAANFESIIDEELARNNTEVSSR